MAGGKKKKGKKKGKTTKKKTGAKKVWKSVSVPEHVKNMVDRIAKSEKLKKYQVVELALSTHLVEKKYRRKGRTYHAGYSVGREVWYAFKLVNSVAQLKFVYMDGRDDAEKRKYLAYTKDTIQQIENRLGVNLADVSKAVDEFIKNPSSRTVTRLNDETKVAMLNILVRGG